MYVSPEVADEITVFITIAFGPANAPASCYGPPAPPLMTSPVMRMNKVPVVNMVKFVG